MWHQHLERLKQAEEELSTEEHGVHYSVPRIIAIGEESSGKSSTLERLAMLEFFPSDRRLCTRMPIELRLRYNAPSRLPEEFLETGYVMMSLVRSPTSSMAGVAKTGPMKPAKVEEQVRTWMEEVVREQNGELVGVTEDRLVIELYSLRKLNLDLIDLPGIVGGALRNEPSNMADQTKAVTSRYLDDPAHPHTFVVCVVPATQDRIRNSQSMELVQRFRKEDKTIGVLTKADLSGLVNFRDEPYEMLKDRLKPEVERDPAIGTDCIELGLGYVALMNRDTALETRPELEEANRIEAEWFAEYVPHSQGTCGIRALTDKIVNALESYTANTWFGLERKRLLTEREKAKVNLNVLGSFIPSSLDDLITQTRKLLPEANKIWTYYAVEQCAASHCRVAELGNLFCFDPAEGIDFGNTGHVCFNFEIASQQKFPQNMNGWTLHSEQILTGGDGARKTASSPPGAFVFGDHNFSGPRRADIVSFFLNSAASVPYGQLVFCGEQVSSSSYLGVYGEGSLGSPTHRRHQVMQHTDTGSSSLYLDRVGSAEFSEKLKLFFTQAVARGYGPRFDPGGFYISGEALGLPSGASIPEVTKCFFGSGWKGADEQKFVVLTFPAVQTLTANAMFTASDPYEMTAQVNQAFRGMVAKTCKKVISEHVDALLSHLVSCDSRFPKFQAALGQVLNTWTYDVTETVCTRMDSWLTCFYLRRSSTGLPIPTVETVSALFSQANFDYGRHGAHHHTFCNPLAITLSITLHEQLRAYSLTDQLSSADFKTELLRHNTEAALIRETCAEDREGAIAKVEAITGMLNVMNEVFSNNDASIVVNDVGVN